VLAFMIEQLRLTSKEEGDLAGEREGENHFPRRDGRSILYVHCCRARARAACGEGQP
jgi:hypothetical protein